jgi:hypothetical protein
MARATKANDPCGSACTVYSRSQSLLPRDIRLCVGGVWVFLFVFFFFFAVWVVT